MRNKTLSVIIIAYNEEKRIEQCLRSVAWVNEIVVVVDDKSTDKTAEISRKYTSKVYLHRFEGYGKQKQFALNHATGEWVLILDADEELQGSLRRKLRSLVENPQADYFTYAIVCARFALAGRYLLLNEWN